MVFLFFINCGIKPELLPVKKYPNVEEILFLKKIVVSGDKIKKIFYKNGIKFPFFIYFKLKDVSGKGFIVLNFYNDKKKIYSRKFSFGKEGKIYESIIIWDRIEIKKYKKLRYTIFYKKNLIYEGKIYL